MLSVIIATDGQEHPAVLTLSALVSGVTAGLVREVLLVDSSGSATIARVADVAGCHYLASTGGRADAFALGATETRSSWLLFLPAGAVLDPTWIDEAVQFIDTITHDGRPRAALFRQTRSPYEHFGWRDALDMAARSIGLRSADPGLMIARDHYNRLGGFDARTSHPEARLLRRLGRARVVMRSRIIVIQRHP